MNFDDSVFKANDIRAPYPEHIDEAFAHALGQAVVSELDNQKVLLGRDCRLSSPSMAGAAGAGVRAAGGQIGYVGLCPSELIYYLMGDERGYDVAVMVTASHNPPEYNGFKLVGSGGAPVTSADGLGVIKEWMQEAPEPRGDSFSEPEQTVFARGEYVNYVMDHTGGRKDFSDVDVVVDPGNGTGGVLWDDLEEATGLEAVKMNYKPDGRFPAHMPNPAKMKNVQPLIDRVREEEADIGFCFDGDSDRTVAVLDDGRVMGGSQMIAALVDSLFADDSSAHSAVSMTSSRKLLDFLRKRGPEPLIVPVGHAKVKRIMRSNPDIDFAGEESGHYFFREFFCCESALMTTLYLLQSVADERLQTLIGELPGPWVQPDPEPAFHYTERSEALAASRTAALETLDMFPDEREIMCEFEWEIRRDCEREDIENATGVRVDYADWWFAVRPSGTEPLARLAGEARTEDLLNERLNAIGRFFE